jgi:phosphate transport system permease protein
MATILVLALIAVAVAAWITGRSRALASVNGHAAQLHSLPAQHGTYLALIAAGPAFVLLIIWVLFAPGVETAIVRERLSSSLSSLSSPEAQAFLRDARTLAAGGAIAFVDAAKENAAGVFRSVIGASRILLAVLVVVLAAAGFAYGLRQIAPRFRARHMVERTVRVLLLLAATIAIVTTVGIVLSLLFESLRFFAQIPFYKFLFGIHWSPQSAFTGAGGGGEPVNPDIFGAVPLFTGTLLITLIAMVIAAPVGLMAAIYLSDYASRQVRAVAKPVLEILAGIPTVVYGFFAALTVAPFFRGVGESVGLGVASESALAAGVVMGVMIIPFVSSLSDDILNAVPQSLRDGSAGLGATKSETIRKVVLPAALPGIVSALLLAVSRAIGETMIVVMAAGLAANLTANPLQAVTTVTVQIVTLLVGDQEFDSPKTLAAFALGLVLFCVTLVLNIVALRIVRKYRELYD